MSILRSRMRGKVHLLDATGKRVTKCGRSLGALIEEGGTGDPVVFESADIRILVKLDGLDGVTCHHCRWGRDNRALPRYY